MLSARLISGVDLFRSSFCTFRVDTSLRSWNSSSRSLFASSLAFGDFWLSFLFRFSLLSFSLSRSLSFYLSLSLNSSRSFSLSNSLYFSRSLSRSFLSSILATIDEIRSIEALFWFVDSSLRWLIRVSNSFSCSSFCRLSTMTLG